MIVRVQTRVIVKTIIDYDQLSLPFERGFINPVQQGLRSLNRREPVFPFQVVQAELASRSITQVNDTVLRHPTGRWQPACYLQSAVDLSSEPTSKTSPASGRNGICMNPDDPPANPAS